MTFASLPNQSTRPAEPVFPSKQTAQVREELQALLEKGGTSDRQPRRLLLEPVPSTQEEWANETGD